MYLDELFSEADAKAYGNIEKQHTNIYLIKLTKGFVKYGFFNCPHTCFGIRPPRKYKSLHTLKVHRN